MFSDEGQTLPRFLHLFFLFVFVQVNFIIKVINIILLCQDCYKSFYTLSNSFQYYMVFFIIVVK